MIDKDLNFSLLISSYLYCKSIDDFLSNQHGFYDVRNLSLLKSLIDSVKASKGIGFERVRLKIAVSYLINQYGAFFKNKTEESFFSILTTLFNENLNRFITLDVLTELRSITLKKASVLVDEGFFQKNEEKVQDFIIKDHFYVRNDNQNEIYTNESFYNDLSEIFDQKLDFRNSSIIFEIFKSFDFNDENGEEILIKKIQSLEKGIYQLNSPSSRKIVTEKNNESVNGTEKQNVMKNDREKQNVSPVIDFQKRISAAFEEPTASKLRATRISSIDYSAFQKSFNEDSDSDDELDFNLTPRIQPSRKSKESNKSTSSPKPTTSKKASFLNTDSEDDSNKKRIDNASKNRDNSSDEKSTRKSLSKKIKLTKEKKISANSISDISNIEPDNDTEICLNESKSTGKRIKWSEKETIYLAIGVELYGKGCWAKILKRFNEQLRLRSTVQLKDKYRNMERADELKHYTKLAKTFIDKNKIES